jgi:AcrR family transcriptional regulator
VSEEKKQKRLTSRDIKANERKQQILSVAKRLFAERGYHATSMRLLNEELGVAEALTYHYFPGGKLEILHTIIQEGLKKRIEEITHLVDLLNEDMSLREVLLSLARFITTLFTADKELIQIVLRERKWLLQEEWIESLRASQTHVHSLFRILTERMNRGEIREMDLRLAFGQFSSSIILRSLLDDDSVTLNDESSLEKLVDFTVQLWSR